MLPPDAFARATFEATFGAAPDAVASAPGRVNLLGEHTDYNGGAVLPVALARRTRVVIGRLPGRTVRVRTSEPTVDTPFFEYEAGAEMRRGIWADYAQGVTVALARAGWAPDGFAASIDSDVPPGAGLASSAALEVALVRAMAAAFGLDLDPLRVARIAHEAETRFVGAPVGLMDQCAASFGDAGAALFLDTRTFERERLPLPAGCGLVVIHSGERHHHATGGYRTRRRECEAAAAALGVSYLVEARPADIERARLAAPLDRRARHVVSEQARVLEARRILRGGNAPEALGRLMNESHDSQRDDFDVSTGAVDRLAAAARAEAGVFGARLTGGGFGGAIVALVKSEAAAAVAGQLTALAGTREAIVVEGAPRQ